MYAQGSGSALKLDGLDDHVSIQPSADLLGNNGNSITLECWVKLHRLEQWAILLSKGKNPLTGNNEPNYDFRLRNGKLFFEYKSSINGVFNIFESAGVNSLNIGQYYHCAMTYTFGNSATMRFYIDGSLVQGNWTFGSGSDQPVANNFPLFLGTTICPPSGTPCGAFPGELDEIRIWNRALSQDEIRHKMCQKLTGDEPGLVAYYRMDEGADNTCPGGLDVCDASGNGNHGVKQ
ncbi:MAG: LamG domain-containing protein [Sphingobacteriia bacterium]